MAVSHEMESLVNFPTVYANIKPWSASAAPRVFPERTVLESSSVSKYDVSMANDEATGCVLLFVECCEQAILRMMGVP